MLMYSLLRSSSVPKVTQVAYALLPSGKHSSSRHSSLNVAWCREFIEFPNCEYFCSTISHDCCCDLVLFSVACGRRSWLV